VLGSLVAARVSRRLGIGTVMAGSLLLIGLAQFGFGLTSDRWAAASLFGVSGLAIVLFNVVAGSLRQALAPDRLLGRVISSFRLFSYGAVPLGALLGGVLARAFGLRAPFLVAGIVIPAVTLLSLPLVNNRTIREARAEAGATLT
jgi:MFS family permease